MREAVLGQIRCPKCGREGEFRAEATERNEREIREGAVVCNQCGASYPVHAGVIDLLPSDEMRNEVAAEIDGWVRVHATWFDLSGKKSNFWLVEPDNKETEGISSDEYIRRLPNFDKIGPTFARNEQYKIDSFRQLLEMAEIRPGSRLLELGAARCWTARDFTKMGCRCVATDIVTTKYIGVETSDVYFEEDPGLYWERARCDMEDLPFAGGSFDVVFCNAVLHHSTDPGKVIGEIWRVLAPGGMLLVVNEPDYGIFDKKRNEEAAAAEAADGANENVYNQPFFVKQMKRLGFETNFPPLNWLIKYYAWVIYKKFERFGIKSYRFQQAIERNMARFQRLVRVFIGLGTVGVARKPLK